MSQKVFKKRLDVALKDVAYSGMVGVGQWVGERILEASSSLDDAVFLVYISLL